MVNAAYYSFSDLFFTFSNFLFLSSGLHPPGQASKQERMPSKVHSILGNVSHALHDMMNTGLHLVKTLGQRCTTEPYRKSVLLVANRLFKLSV